MLSLGISNFADSRGKRKDFLDTVAAKLQANLAPEQRFNSEGMLVVPGGFLLGLLGLVVRLVRHFQNVSPRL